MMQQVGSTYITKQLEYITKDHIVMHAIFANLKWFYSLFPQ